MSDRAPSGGEGGDAALAELLEALRGRGYRFVTPTPATHKRVVARPERRLARDLTDMLGWSLPFEPGVIDPPIEALLERAGALEPAGGALRRATLRVSSLDGDLFLHSAFPTDSADAVFFGPDSYRFAALIAEQLARHPRPVRRVVDIGTGAGVGAIAAARVRPEAAVAGTDINPGALRLARINARVAGVALETIESDSLAPIADPIDAVLANPPYVVDDAGREYRDGGGMLGGEIALEMASQGLERLAPGGILVLYTGAAIVAGADALAAALAERARAHGCALDYRELDPDVFGEELEQPAYRTVDRIAVVAAVFNRPG